MIQAANITKIKQKKQTRKSRQRYFKKQQGQTKNIRRPCITKQEPTETRQRVRKTNNFCKTRQRLAGQNTNDNHAKPHKNSHTQLRKTKQAPGKTMQNTTNKQAKTMRNLSQSQSYNKAKTKRKPCKTKREQGEPCNSHAKIHGAVGLPQVDVSLLSFLQRGP